LRGDTIEVWAHLTECRSYPVDAWTWAFYAYHLAYDAYEEREGRRMGRHLRAMDMAQAVAKPTAMRERLEHDPIRPFREPTATPTHTLTVEQRRALFKMTDPLFNAVDLPALEPIQKGWTPDVES